MLALKSLGGLAIKFQYFWLLYSNGWKHNVKCAKHCAVPIAYMAASYLLWQEASTAHIRKCVGKALRWW